MQSGNRKRQSDLLWHGSEPGWDVPEADIYKLRLRNNEEKLLRHRLHLFHHVLGQFYQGVNVLFQSTRALMNGKHLF